MLEDKGRILETRRIRINSGREEQEDEDFRVLSITNVPDACDLCN